MPHNLIVQKHIEALKVAIAKPTEAQSEIAAELLDELEKLVNRL